MATLHEDLKTMYTLNISTTDNNPNKIDPCSTYKNQNISLTTDNCEEVKRIIDLSKNCSVFKEPVEIVSPISNAVNSDGTYNISNPISSIIGKLETAIGEALGSPEKNNLIGDGTVKTSSSDAEKLRANVSIILSKFAEKTKDHGKSIKYSRIASKLDDGQPLNDDEIVIIQKIISQGKSKIKAIVNKIRGEI